MNQPDSQESAQAAPADEPMTMLTSVDMMAELVTSWHTQQMGRLHHLLQIPEGTTFEIGDTKLEISGDVLAGFKFGVELAIMQFKDLPFERVSASEDADTAAGNTESAPQH